MGHQTWLEVLLQVDPEGILRTKKHDISWKPEIVLFNPQNSFWELGSHVQTSRLLGLDWSTVMHFDCGVLQICWFQHPWILLSVGVPISMEPTSTDPSIPTSMDVGVCGVPGIEQHPWTHSFQQPWIFVSVRVPGIEPPQFRTLLYCSGCETLILCRWRATVYPSIVSFSMTVCRHVIFKLQVPFRKR